MISRRVARDEDRFRGTSYLHPQIITKFIIKKYLSIISIKYLTITMEYAFTYKQDKIFFLTLLNCENHPFKNSIRSSQEAQFFLSPKLLQSVRRHSAIVFTVTINNM